MGGLVEVKIDRKQKICIRCGLYEKEVRSSGIKCAVYGTFYGNHKYYLENDGEKLRRLWVELKQELWEAMGIPQLTDWLLERLTKNK